ncbi:MAG TPA: FxLYD domain-containing protein [Gemmatimonadaceae bacterium]
MGLFGRYLTAAGLLAAAAGALGAQAAEKPKCDIDAAYKGNLARASLSLGVAQQAATTPIGAAKLKETVKTLETPDKDADPVARSYLLGSALSLWLNQPNVGATPKRSVVGFTTNPDATIDLVPTIDSLFRIVEAFKPNCQDYTNYYRGGQKYYIDVANAAIKALNEDKLDSAEYYATQANRLFPASPYGTMVLGSVAQKRNNTPKAVEYWTASADVAARDTMYRDVRRQMLVNIGSTELAAANAASGAERTAAARRAAAAYGKLIEMPGTKGSYLYGGRQNLQTALLLAGDTAAFVQTYQPLLQNPTSYEYQDLLNSAVNAARTAKAADAARLFEATLAQNPYSRDALYNLAVTYLALDQNDKVGPIATRLVAVDPGNPDNYNLGARAYLALAKSAQAAKRNPAVAAYNDTTLSWFNRGNKLPVEVTFSEFTPTDKQIIVGGTVLDRRDKVDAGTTDTRPTRGKAAPKPAAKNLPPKAVTLNFQALDRSGAVVGSKSVTTEALTPGKTAKFTVTIDAPNAVAYRYTIAD